MNKAASGVPTEVLPLPLTTVTSIVLSDALDFMPKVTGFVMACDEMKALNCESFSSSSSNFSRTEERALAMLSQSGTDEDSGDMVSSCQ